MNVNSIIRAFGAGCALAMLTTASIAQSVPLTTVQMQRFSEMSRRATSRPATVERQAGVQSGPQLTALRVGTSVNASLSGAQLKVTLTAADAVAGLTYASIYATSPTGRNASYASLGFGYPRSPATATAGLTFGVFNEPGTWTITQVTLDDDAGGSVYYDADQLKAFGNMTFTVTQTDPRALDVTPPVFVGGAVLTPTVSLTRQVDPLATWAGVQARTTDAGDPVSSGINYLQTMFCLMDHVHCLYISQAAYALGQTAATFKMGSDVAYASSWLIPGSYYLQSVTVMDNAGNTSTLVSKRFGGTTDFSTYFPNGDVITLTN